MIPRSLAALRQPKLRSLNPRLSKRFTSTRAPQSRIARLESRLPAFLRRYTLPLRTAPVSHISAFLLLHEITAVIPLFGLTATFHYFNWLPPWVAEGAVVKSGVEKFGKYMRRKGWIDEDAVPGEDAKEGRLGTGEVRRRAGKVWGKGESGVRLVVEVATAYAVTKLLLPVRLVFSVWATPGFARWTVVPVAGWVKRLVLPVMAGAVGVGSGGGRAPVASFARRARLSPGAGTNAVGGGVLPRVGGSVK
jgi:hypothetical protein